MLQAWLRSWGPALLHTQISTWAFLMVMFRGWAGDHSPALFHLTSSPTLLCWLQFKLLACSADPVGQAEVQLHQKPLCSEGMALCAGGENRPHPS